MTSQRWITPHRDQPVVFAGRYELNEISAPVIEEALPRSLYWWNATHWVIADPLAFPYEQLTARQWDAPMDIVLPTGMGPGVLTSLLHEPLFRHMTSYDTLATSRPTWEALNPRYGWANSQWRHRDLKLEVTVRRLLAQSRVAARVSEELCEAPQLVESWQARTRNNKSRHRAEMIAAIPILSRALSRRPAGSVATVAEYSDTVGRYLPYLRSIDGTVIAVRSDAGLARQVAFNHPELTVVEPANDDEQAALGLVPESLDVVLVSVDGRASSPSRRATMAQLAAALRVGGSLVIVRRADDPLSLPLGTFSDEYLQATSASLVLEAVESIKDPVTGRSTRSIMQLTKIGVPTRW